LRAFLSLDTTQMGAQRAAVDTEHTRGFGLIASTMNDHLL
jgi:hypothetical protein